MSRFSRLEVYDAMHRTGMVPVFYNPSVEVCKKVLKACYDGGVRVFEFTNRGDGAVVVFKELISYVRESCPEMMLITGSVIDSATAALYISLGTDGIVAPILDEDTAVLCNARKIAWAPGCGSLNDINKAHRLGAEVVKIFPAGAVGGPGFVKAALAPMPWCSIMPTGGVEPERDNLKGWFDAGVYTVGMGSKLFPKSLKTDEDFKALENKCRETLALILEIRGK